MLKIWGRHNSSNVRKVLWCAEEIGLPYESIEVGGAFGGTQTPEYRQMNPNGLVPVIEDHGLPERIRTDNGVPFAASGVTGLTPLSVLFIRLGISQERIEPGKPQQNGLHERFHATLSTAMKPPAQTMTPCRATIRTGRA